MRTMKRLFEWIANRTIIVILLLAMCVCFGACESSDDYADDSWTTRSLTFSSPTWSINGNIAYNDLGSREINNQWVFVDSLAGIYTYNLTSKERRRIVSFGKRPVWSPSGLELMFWHQNSIWIYDMGAENARQLFNNGEYNNPGNWSPSGELLVYASTEESPYDYTIWSVDINSGKRVHLTPDEGGLRDPIWFADGDSILLKRYFEEGGEVRSAFFSMINEGSNPRLFLATKYDEQSLAIAAGDMYLSFHVATSAGSKIHIYDQQNQEYSSSSDISGKEASWSPDGGSIIFVRPSGNVGAEFNAQITIYNLETGESSVLF